MYFIEVAQLSEKEIVPGYVGRAIHTGSLTFMYFTVQAGAEMPLHSHPHEQVSQVITGRFFLKVGDSEQVLQPGQVAVIPPHVPHGGHAVDNCQLLDVFNPERADYKWL